MKLDYATLISPFPVHLQNIGSIKSPTLREIWNPKVTYSRYNQYILLLLMDLQTYCEKVKPQLSEWFSLLSDEERLQLTIFDMILKDSELQKQYQCVLNFFFVEDIVWNNDEHSFFTYIIKEGNEQIVPVGSINKEIWSDICDIILQRCRVMQKKSQEKLKFKNKAAERIWIKTHKNDTKENKNIELPNMVSAYAAFANGINIISIWDMTVYQVYDQFQRQITNNFFNISCMSTAAWGDKDNHFDDSQWYENIHVN